MARRVGLSLKVGTRPARNVTVEIAEAGRFEVSTGSYGSPKAENLRIHSSWREARSDAINRIAALAEEELNA